MCVAPIKIASGETVACLTCWSCRARRVDDFVGRCLAEQFDASQSLALTLTYRGDVVGATDLYYRDVQLMLKRLRSDGFTVRYICAGEHGERKGRAHWHIVLFFYGSAPELPLERRFDWKYWQHGFTFAQTSDYHGFRYLLKYTLKEVETRGFRKVLRLSKKPPLGFSFFADLAQRMVDAGLAVHSGEYSFGHVLLDTPVKQRPRHRVFWLQDTSLRLFLAEYVRRWVETHGSAPPDSDYLWEHFYDPIARAELDSDSFDLERSIALRCSVAQSRAASVRMPAYAVQTGFLLLDPGQVVVRYSDGSAVLVKDGKKWRLEGCGISEGGGWLKSQLVRTGLKDRSASAASLWLSEPLPPRCPVGSITPVSSELRGQREASRRFQPLRSALSLAGRLDR